MIHCKKNFIQIDANQQSGIIICHYLFVKRNTSSKQFPIFSNHEKTRKVDRILKQYISSSAKSRVLFFAPTFMIYHRTLDQYSREQRKIYGQSGTEKSRFAVDEEPSCRCAIPPLTEALRSQAFAMHSSVPRIFFLSACAEIVQEVTESDQISYLGNREWQVQNDQMRNI